MDPYDQIIVREERSYIYDDSAKLLNTIYEENRKNT
jgi:hypothetical protein